MELRKHHKSRKVDRQTIAKIMEKRKSKEKDRNSTSKEKTIEFVVFCNDG